MTRDRPERLNSVLDSYIAAGATETADVERIRAALAAGDVYARTTTLHVTASAIVVHRPTGRVLLRWHPRMQMWMQVGGHFDAGEDDPLTVALREAGEETGLTDLRPLDAGPIQIVIVPVPAFGEEAAHEHADIRYVLATDAPDAIEPESDAARLRWLPLDDARRAVHEDNLRELLDRAARIA